MILSQFLQNLGLSDKEAQVYLAGLSLGAASVQEIAIYANIKRTTVYEVIKSLQEKKLVDVTYQNKKRLFIAEEPENILLFLKQREKMLEQIIPDLEALKNTKSNRPTIRIFEGIEGLKHIYEDMIKKPGEILAFTAPIENIAATLLDYLDSDWKIRRIANKIYFKTIRKSTAKEKSLDYKKIKFDDKLEEIYYLPPEHYPFSVGIYIYRGKVAFVSFMEKELIGIIIKSEEIKQTLTMMFKLFWIGKVYN